MQEQGRFSGILFLGMTPGPLECPPSRLRRRETHLSPGVNRSPRQLRGHPVTGAARRLPAYICAIWHPCTDNTAPIVIPSAVEGSLPHGRAEIPRQARNDNGLSWMVSAQRCPVPYGYTCGGKLAQRSRVTRSHNHPTGSSCHRRSPTLARLYLCHLASMYR